MSSHAFTSMDIRMPVVEAIEEVYPALAASLRELTADFQYTRLLDLLEQSDDGGDKEGEV